MTPQVSGQIRPHIVSQVRSQNSPQMASQNRPQNHHRNSPQISNQNRPQTQPINPTPSQYSVSKSLQPPILPNNTAAQPPPAGAPVKQNNPLQLKKAPSSNFDLLSDFASIPKIVADNAGDTKNSQDGNLAIMDKLTQMNQQKVLTN
jgi:hypothetical protein